MLESGDRLATGYCEENLLCISFLMMCRHHANALLTLCFLSPGHCTSMRRKAVEKTASLHLPEEEQQSKLNETCLRYINENMFYQLGKTCGMVQIDQYDPSAQVCMLRARCIVSQHLANGAAYLDLQLHTLSNEWVMLSASSFFSSFERVAIITLLNGNYIELNMEAYAIESLYVAYLQSCSQPLLLWTLRHISVRS